MRWQSPSGGELELHDDFLSASESASLFATLQHVVPWQKRAIRIAGRDILEPRKTAWIGDDGAVYTYSGRTNAPTPWPDVLRPLRARISQCAGADFNSVLCNLYEDGRDSMGLHADAEPELGQNPVIASLSLGATRRFQLRHRKQREEKLDLDLQAGSLLIMRGTLQMHYRHGVPKQPKITAARINLTFRRISMR